LPLKLEGNIGSTHSDVMNATETAKDPDRDRRAADFKARVRATGLTPTDFAKRAGLTRNVYYRLSTGQRPKPDQQSGIDAVFLDPTIRQR